MADWKGLDDFNYDEVEMEYEDDNNTPVYYWKPHFNTEDLKDTETNISSINGTVEKVYDGDYGITLLILNEDEEFKVWTPSHKHLQMQIKKMDIMEGDYVNVQFLKKVEHENQDGNKFTNILYKLLRWED